MVSGSQVSSDASSLSSYCSSYTSQVDGLTSSWKGASYDSVSTQSQQVVSEFFDTIKNQLELYASACDMYEEYCSVKSSYEVAAQNYNTAVSNQDNSAIQVYGSQMSQFESKKNEIKQNILNTLSSSSATKLSADAIATKDLSSGKVLSSSGVDGIVQGAIDWALAVAADDSFGYSQSTRWGNPNYDCSSLVISAYEAAGLTVKESGASFTGDMRSAFLENGFVWIPGDPDVSSLQPGDVLLNENSHTEMYIGNGMNVGAHDDFDGSNGDSGGNEISVSNYRSHPWDGFLRYVGYDNTQEIV